MSDRLKLAREIAARTKPRFIEIPREKRRSVPFTEEQLTAMRGGLTAEEYRWKLIQEWLDLPCATAKSANETMKAPLNGIK